jgi:prophage tail gpP-like protein
MLSLLVDKQEIKNFTQAKIQLNYTAIASTFTILLPKEISEFLPFNLEHIKLMWNGNITLLHGFVVRIKPTLSSAPTIIEVAGYSHSGVLNDVTIGADDEQQYNDISLFDLAKILVKDHRCGVEISPGAEELANKQFKEIEISPSASLVSTLKKLAQQRGIMLRSNNEGNLLLDFPTKKKPFISLEEGKNTIINTDTNTSIVYDVTKMHNIITATGQASDDDSQQIRESAVVNDLIPSSANRPKIVIQAQGGSDDTEQLAKVARAAEYQSLSLTMNVVGWEVASIIPQPGDVVELLYPSLFINKKSLWIISQNVLSQDANGILTSQWLLVPANTYILEKIERFIDA